MSDYSHLSNEELKAAIAKGEEALRSSMPAKEYEKFIKEMDSKKVTLTPAKSRKCDLAFDMDLALSNAPGFVVALCKIINPILTFFSFIFMIGGGLFSLFCAYNIYQLYTVSGWHGIFETVNTLFIIAYFISLFIIGKIRLLVYRIIE